MVDTLGREELGASGSVVNDERSGLPAGLTVHSEDGDGTRGEERVGDGRSVTVAEELSEVLVVESETLVPATRK